MIKKINKILPKEINRNIISILIREGNWNFADDVARFNTEKRNIFVENLIDKDFSNSGFSFVTFDRKHNINVNSSLNIFADIIFFKIKETIKIKQIERIYWNYYDSSSEANFHVDEYEDKYKSIIYNLHTNDGGTQIENKFFPSVESQAIIFKSNFSHKGIACQSKKHRFNLNMIVQ